MRTFLALALALTVAAAAPAQILRPKFDPQPSPARHDDHGADRGGRRDAGYWRGDYVRRGPVVYVDFRPARVAYYDDYAYAPYGYGFADYDYYSNIRPSYAASGLWLGALAGAVIGHNSGDLRHNGWRGAAWGAGLGWLLGSIADANRPAIASTPAVVTTPRPTTATAQPPAPAQPVTIINNYYGTAATPMSGANALFGRN
jgi:hypothetical protein